MNRFYQTVLLWVLLPALVLAQESDSLSKITPVFGIDLTPKPPVEDTTSLTPEVIDFWKDGGLFSINIQQVALRNWAAGGNPSVAIGGNIEGFVNYEKDQVVWENQVKVGYGVIRNGGAGNDFEKTDDLVILTSKFSQKFTENILMSTALNFRTQMDQGFKNETNADGDQTRVFISDFMAPGYLQASLGLTYRDNQRNFRVTVAPFTGRFTFVLNDSLSNVGSFGVEPGEQIRSEAGISLTGKFERTLLENIKFRTNVNLFSNYEKFPNTVVNIEAGLNLKVNNFISSNISSQIIYDDDVILTRNDGSRGRDVQMKNVINVGFTIGF